MNNLKYQSLILKPDAREFDVLVRSLWYRWPASNIRKRSRCTMDPTSDKFIGRRIGTVDGFICF
jgi:hypothetical protein